MKRVAAVVFAVALAVLAGLGARELWVAHRGDGRPSDPPPETIAAMATITPDVHTFGEPVVATVDVLADATLVKPKTIRVETDFAPYELTGPPSVERDVVDGIAHVVFRYPLRCLREGCDAAAERGVAQFEPGFVLYRFVQGSAPGRGILDWPPIQVASRVSKTDVADMRWRASETALPAMTTRFGPTGLAAALVAAALALVATAAWLAGRLWPAECREEPEVVSDARTPLARALALALAESRNGASLPKRRQTLERLARELGAVGQRSLADHARELAWAPRAATGDEVAAFVQQVASATEAGGAA